MVTETLRIRGNLPNLGGPSGTQNDAPERNPRGNSGAEDANSATKNTVEDRKLKRENLICTREGSSSGESN